MTMHMFADPSGPPVTYTPGLFSEYDLDELVREIRPQQYTWSMYGKSGNRMRLERWYHDDPSRLYGFGGGAPMVPTPFTGTMRELRIAVEIHTGHEFDSCFANLYRNERDSIDWHADDEAWIGPVIASVSFGSPRRFRMRHKVRTPGRKHPQCEYRLGHGDLLVMGAGCQDVWEHCVPRQAAAVGPRLNLTFRQTRPRAQGELFGAGLS